MVQLCCVARLITERLETVASLPHWIATEINTEVYMPVITNGMELPILPNSYSPESIARTKTELAAMQIAGTGELVRFYLANDKSHACVVRGDVDESGRHTVLVKLDFYQKSDLVYTAADFWEDETTNK